MRQLARYRRIIVVYSEPQKARQMLAKIVRLMRGPLRSVALHLPGRPVAHL
jgi:hypothetical protein